MSTAGSTRWSEESAKAEVASPDVRFTRLARSQAAGNDTPLDLALLLEQARTSMQDAPRAPIDLLSRADPHGSPVLWKLNAAQTLVAASRSFTPMVDDPLTFGRIAATGALSQVFATGATPLFALASFGAPRPSFPVENIAHILLGAETALSASGAAMIAGNAFEAVVPTLALVVLGSARPDRLRQVGGAEAGDAIVLAKPLGLGIYAAAYDKQKLDDAAYRSFVHVATQANAAGIALAAIKNVHAQCEVADAGLAGQLLAMCRAAALPARIAMRTIPCLPHALALAKAGCINRMSARNWNRYGAAIRLDDALMPETRALLTDPQMSGGLLVACKPTSADRVVRLLRDAGCAAAAEIGRFGTEVEQNATSRAAWLEITK